MITHSRFPKATLHWLLAACAFWLTGSTCQDEGGSEVNLGAPTWAGSSVGYEIFVRSFKDSNSDGIGDLAGLQAMLPYLNDGPSSSQSLGINLLWLTPIYPSPSYHGYDVTDYKAIHPEMGTLEDFRRFVEEAHRRGIKVILDLEANHTSSQHPWFLQASAPDSPKRDYYIWRKDNPGWRQPWSNGSGTWHPSQDWFFYGLFGPWMPDLNYLEPDVLNEMKQVIGFWVQQGVDGFRVDAARHLVEDETGVLSDTAASHQVAQQLKKYLRQQKKDGLLIAEAWTTVDKVATYAGKQDEYDLAFDFALASSIQNALFDGNADAIEQTLQSVEQAYPFRGFDIPFLANHDMDRIGTTFAGNKHLLRIGMTLVLTLPGTPFLYYGEEIGMANAGRCQGDICRRAPMPWDASPDAGFSETTPWTAPADDSATVNVAALAQDPNSLLALVRALIRARLSHPALTSTARERIQTGSSKVYAYLRGKDAHPVLVVLNLSPSPQTATLNLSAVGEPGQPQASTELLSGKTRMFPADRANVLTEELPAGGVLLFEF